MDKDKSPSLSSTPGTWLWLATLAAGMLFFREIPWRDARSQAADPQAYRYVAQQDIDARLWQDPLGAVARALASADKTLLADKSDQERHSASALANDIQKRGIRAQRILTIGAMVRGGPYPEAAESRRRARYAILAGLNEQGFVPDNAEHLGYFTTALSEESRGELPKLVVYEWFRLKGQRVSPAAPLAAGTNTQNPVAIDRILLLWLDEDVFGVDTIARLAKLTQAITPAGSAPANRVQQQFLVLGPGASTTLQEMAINPGNAADSLPAHVPFYSSSATADDWRILNRAGNTVSSVHDFFKQKNRFVFRSIGTDKQLADALAAELILRGVDPNKILSADAKRDCPQCQHVVLISEWDSLYGRALPQTLTESLLDKSASSRQITVDNNGVIHSYSYLRGLDGMLPSTRASDNSSAGSTDTKKTGSDANDEEKRIERAEGQSQFDYLRRLSLHLHTLEKQLRLQNKGKISAIGVLGSDVNDKLLILQALHTEFPSAIFFTTDLDARMLHPRELEWTRNLIVASSFGLELNENLQRDILPFRDGYQTALYLATLTAIYNANHGNNGADSDCQKNERQCFPIDQQRLQEWLNMPKIFEIGRHGAFDYGSGAPHQAALLKPEQTSAADATVACRAGALAQCRDILPPAPQLFTTFAEHTLRTACALLTIAALVFALALGYGQKAVHWLKHGKPKRIGSVARGALLLSTAAVIIACIMQADAGWITLARYLSENGRGEPVFAFAGISVWPTELIRAMGLLLSLLFIVRGVLTLDRNLDEISEKLMCQPQRRIIIEQLKQEYRHWPLWLRFLRIFSFKLSEVSHRQHSAATGLSENAEIFWKKYIYQARWCARWVRIVTATVLYWAVARMIMRLFSSSIPPYRGSIAADWDHWWVKLAVVAMLLLIFFVVDATVLCCHLLSALRQDLPAPTNQPNQQSIESRWPKETLQRFASATNLPECYLDYWINMHMIGRRTVAVGNLIYYPFVIIALMLISRSSIFDHWSLAPGQVIVMSCSALLISACALALRWQAETARKKALWRLGNEKIRLKGGSDVERRTADQLDAMLNQIREFNSGAFAPYSQQPLLRALLIPLSSYGGALLLEYFNFANF